MSGTSSKSYVVKARQGKTLNWTPKGHIRLNATIRNPRANEEGQPATKPADQLFNYAYMITGTEDISMPNGETETLDVIKGFRFTPYDGSPEVTMYISDIDIPKQWKAS